MTATEITETWAVSVTTAGGGRLTISGWSSSSGVRGPIELTLDGHRDAFSVEEWNTITSRVNAKLAHLPSTSGALLDR